MTFEILLLLVLLGAMLAAFVTEVLPLEVTALCLLTALLATGLVSFEEAISGLSNQAVLTVGAMFVLGHALAETGILERAADRLSHSFGRRRGLALVLLLLVASVFSGFLNNTAVVAIFLPLAVDLCRRLGLAPSRVLIPLSYAAILGGTLTLIGTSTNLLVSAIADERGQAPIGMFELAPLGLVFLGVGLAYVVLLGPRLLPDRFSPASLTSKYQMSDYLMELRVLPGSKLVDRTVEEIDLNRRYDVTVLSVLRDEESFVENLRALPLAAGDLLIVRGSTDRLHRMRTEQGVDFLADPRPDDDLAETDQAVVEALVSPNSALIGSTIEEADFRRRYRAFVLAIRRHGSTIHTRLERTPLEFSDTLLLVAPRERLESLADSEELIVLSEKEMPEPTTRRFGWLIFLVLPAVVAGAAAGLFDIAAGALVGCVLVLASGALEPREAYRSIDWSVLVFLAALVPLGAAMFNSGAAEYLASLLLRPLGVLPPELAPWVALSALYLFTSFFTEAVSNNATAIVLTPLAIAMAGELAVDPRPFVIAVCFAASASFMTPVGYQTNMMVYGPGGYRFGDFVRFGTPLNLLFWVVASCFLPVFWPF